MLKKIFYTLWIAILGLLFFISIKNGSYSVFIRSMEDRAFDIRQSVLSKPTLRKPDKNIVIIAIDDASYEYILDNYGEWPLRRDIYAKVVDYIESQNPKNIAFDLMFVKSIKSEDKADEALIEVFRKYPNVYTSMNLDNQEKDLRAAEEIPDKLALNVKNNSKRVDIDYYEYTNCRKILQEIIDSTNSIGMINVLRGDDGVLRKMPVFLKYQDKYYPQLGLKVALDSLGLKNKKDFKIDKHGNLILDKGKKIYLDSDGSVILNWFGPATTYTNIPLYKILKIIDGKEKNTYNFKNKTIYFGATASSLFDIKTVPVDKVYPGVEVQATYVNNLINGDVIRKTPVAVNITIYVLIALITSILVLKIASMPLAAAISATIYIFYSMVTYAAMRYSHLWLELVAPIAIGVITFIVTVIIKYLIKSKDFDEQYKLATTDGLTELYNHRYFQEQMQHYVGSSARYSTTFSLIIADIDFFKKFNDNFGHQSGDAVLKQVAALLKKNVRATDIVCRYGGEELSIILPNAQMEEAVSIAEKLRTIVASQKFKLFANKESNVTMSMGVATYGQDGFSPEELISAADKRLYNAKNSGRNKVN